MADTELEQEEINSVHDDLSAAWDEFESTEEEVVEDVETQQSGGEAEAEDTESDTNNPDDASPVSADAKQAESGEEENEYEKPPVGISASAREAWKDAPKAIKAEMAKREKDFATGIQKYAETANRAKQMDQTLAPFQQLFAMNGGSPVQTIQPLLQTAATLQMGNPVQRAQTVANLINQFGVDIRTLDGMLTGQQVDAPRETQLTPEIQQLQQTVQQMQQERQQQQEYQAQAGKARINNELQQFASSNEFYEDVKGLMADQFDIADKNNQQLPLDECYRRACIMHPEVSQIMQNRQAAPTPDKRRAASSISGTRSGGGSATGERTMRQTIEDAWDNAGSV